jgi:hypothetical protein
MAASLWVSGMSFEPYLRAADDGTYELLVPSTEGAIHVLPYCFHTQEDAADWLASRKGGELIGKIRSRFEKSKRRPHRYPLQTEAAIS